MSWNIGDMALAATVVIALAALVRPDIGRLYRRRRATIEAHPAGRIEVGFSNFGPTIGLQGTLRAINDDQFVSLSKVIVERLADHLRHDFEWAVFRPQAFSFTSQQQTFEIAAGFSLSESAPRRFNIQFHDRATADRFQPAFIELQRIWMEHLQSKSIIMAKIPSSDIETIYNNFQQAHIADISPLHQIIDRQFYWIEGKYNIIMEIKTRKPDGEHRFSYAFNLSESESKSLRINAIACLLTACNVPNATFNFAYPQYLNA